MHVCGVSVSVSLCAGVCARVLHLRTPLPLPTSRYSLLRLPYDGTCLLVCSERLSHLAQTLGSEYQLVTQVEGSALEGGLYTSPFLEEGRGEEGVDELPFLPGDHVTAASGTGLVHTAPAHGLEDFHVGLKHGLSLVSAA